MDVADKVGRFVVNGNSIDYRLRVSPRARLLRIQIRPDEGVTVIVPRGTDSSTVLNALQAHSRWIVRRLKLIEVSHVLAPGLADGTALPYLGGHLRLEIGPSDRAGTRIWRDDEALRLMLAESDREMLAGVVEAWYRREAGRLIPPRVSHFGSQFGARPVRISIRSQRTLWASCSSRGTLSFNWRLVAAPPTVMDYVIIHELTHIEEMNHSGRFWAKVGARCPDFRDQKAWLKTNAVRLLNWP